MRRALLVVVAGCAEPAHAPPPVFVAPPQVTVELGVDLPPSEPAADGSAPGLDQPPDVKLALGHYRNAGRGIGLVIDRTQREARLRFDHTRDILHLDPAPAAFGRTDYMLTAHQTLLQVWDDGRVVVYVPGGDGTGLEVRRDGDAEPL